MTEECNPRTRIKERVLVSSFLPASTGSGVETFVRLLSDALARHGREVLVIDSTQVFLPGPLKRIRPLAAWVIGRRINRIASERDVILCNGFFSWNARRKKSAIVYHGTERGRVIGTGNWMGLFRRLTVRWISATLDKRAGKGRTVIAVSGAVGDEIREYYGHDVHAVIPNAVNLGVFKPIPDKRGLRAAFGLPENKFLVLFVGPADPRKGLEWIIRDLQPRFPKDFHLVLRTKMTRNQPNSTVIGRLSDNELVRLYNACDVLLMPSAYEGCSYVIVEALACGLPVVSSHTGAAVDMSHNNQLVKYVVNGLDAEKYLSCMERLASSADEWTETSSAARKYAEEYHSITDFERKYLQVIVELQASQDCPRDC